MIYLDVPITPVGRRYSEETGSWIHIPITLKPKPIVRPGDTTYYRHLLVYASPSYGAGVQVPDGAVSCWLSLGTDVGPDPGRVWFNPYMYCNPVNIAVPDTAQTAPIAYDFWFDFRLDAPLPSSAGQLAFVVRYYDYGLDANPLLAGKVVM